MSRLLQIQALVAAVRDIWCRWQKRRHDNYWGLDSYTDVDITRALAAAGAKAQSGCVCEGCERLRNQVAAVIFRVNSDDIAYLAQYGIAWEVSS